MPLKMCSRRGLGPIPSESPGCFVSHATAAFARSPRRLRSALDAIPRAANTPGTGSRSSPSGSATGGTDMRLRISFGYACAAALLVAAQASADVRVTNDHAGPTSYVRYDGTADAATQACGTSRRPQNEPTVAIDPHSPNVVVAGSNDYCAQA